MTDNCPKCDSAAISARNVKMPHTGQIFKKKKCLNCGCDFE